MKDAVIVLGAGGHAKVVIEILRASGYQVGFCVGGEDSPDECIGVAVLRGDERLVQLRNEGYRKIFPAIGSNMIRERVSDYARSLGYELVNAISPHAHVSPSARLGSGVAIMGGAVINAESQIEDLAIINTGAVIDHDCRIGMGAHIAPQSGLAGNVCVGSRAFLGIGCKVIPTMIIGNDSIVGAGGVVISNIPAGVVAVGVPAKIIKSQESLV